MKAIKRMFRHLIPLLPLCLAAAAGPDDAASGCGIRFRDFRPVAIPCPRPTKTVEGAGRNGAVPLTGFRGPLRVTGAYRVIETGDASSASYVAVDGLIGDAIQREGVRLKEGGRFTQVAFRNFRLQHAALPNLPPHMPEGFHIESGRDILIENGTIRGFQMIGAPRGYWNGDGIATERRVAGVTIRNVAVLDNTDAGLDLKSTGNVLDNVYAAGNKRNVRLWASTRATTLMIGPVNRRGGWFSTAGLWINGGAERPVVSIDTLIVDMGNGGAPAGVIVVEGGPAEVRVGRCIVRSVPAGTRFVVAPAGSTIALGGGCPSGG